LLVLQHPNPRVAKPAWPLLHIQHNQAPIPIAAIPARLPFAAFVSKARFAVYAVQLSLLLFQHAFFAALAI